MKNWLPAVPAGSLPPLAIATVPFGYIVPFGGTSSVLYPGPPLPVPVGSPPWMTKFLAIRWKISPSKKWCCARNTKLFTAFGAVFGVSRMTMVPHEVCRVAWYCLFRLMVKEGALPKLGFLTLAAAGTFPPQATPAAEAEAVGVA